ncbi:MAG: hypothetical protein K8I30_16960, partial [Anaerolineae bacterium]|nr:hypothetical protein [Anaerolineae bacterium]
DPGGETGTVERIVNYEPGSGVPDLAATAQCAADRTASFTVTNNGDDMITPDQVMIYDLNDNLILTAPVQLDGGDNQTFTLSNQSGNVRLELTDDTSVTANTDCYYPPEISVSASCSGNLVVFTVTNARPTDGPMSSAQNYTIYDSANNAIVSGQSFQLGLGVATVNISIPGGSNPYDTYRFESSGAVGTFNVSHNCATQPVLGISGTCAIGAPGFVINNTGGDMVLNQDYTITDAGGGTVATGQISIPSGGSTTITLPNTENPYAAHTFTSTGFAGDITLTHSCAQPALTISSSCVTPLRFTVTNNGGNMIWDQGYTITADGTPVQTGTFRLNAGASRNFSLSNTDPYVEYIFSTTGFAGDVSQDQTCDRPLISVAPICQIPFAVTVTNNGGTVRVEENYTIVNSDGTVVASGQLDLDAGETQTITLANESPYRGYTFQTSGFSAITEQMDSCGRPNLDVSYTCSTPPSFTISNTGTEMKFGQNVTVTGENGNVVINEYFELDGGASQTFVLNNVAPYESFTLVSGGFAGTLNMSGDCGESALRVEAICEEPAKFVLYNDGPLALADQEYKLTNNTSGTILTSSTFSLNSGDSMSIAVPENGDLAGGVTFASDENGASAELSMACYDGLTALPTVLPTGTTFGGLDLGGLPDWSSVPTCGYNCPIFQLYHTDEVGGWEIFRLDGADELTRTTIRENLSLGLDEDVENMAPSLSPNNEWIIFQSNRDGNWELYVAPTNGGNPDAVQRVTYNTVAIDSDPMWGPNNFVVYESSRHGNWDLYLIDMATGQEYRLTDDEAEDINPFWSPDGSRIVFQSNRADENGQRRWQIYEINLMARTITRLSDGSSIDVEPQYAHDGTQIAYRTYTTEDGTSTLAIMDVNSGESRQISDEKGDATNIVWSPSDRYIAYQSNLDGDLDVYVYETGTGETRQLSDNEIADYAPTWLCDDERVMFTSDVEGEPNIFEAEVAPISDPGILVEEDADQMTFELANDVYPMSAPAEENASREGQTVLGAFGEQTVFLEPDASLTPLDLSIDGIIREDWEEIKVCPAA